MTEVAPQEIERVMRGLVFVGTHPGPSASNGGGLTDHCAVETARLRERLAHRGRDLESCLALDICYDPAATTADAVVVALAGTLPGGCRPCVTPIPVTPGALGGRGLALQAVSSAEPVHPAGIERFPNIAATGPVVAIGGQTAPLEGSMVAQTTAVMERTADLIAPYGVGWDDTVRLDVFYRDEGTVEAWAVNARERARHFSEPGPAATGVPVGELSDDSAWILVRAIAVRSARALGLRAHSWPAGHWDWPFHLPYKHGCACADTIFIGGQVALTPGAEVIDPGRLDLQAARSVQNVLAVAAELGKGPEDVLRLVAYYQHQDAQSPTMIEQAVRAELDNRDVELSLIGLPYLAYPGMVVEIGAEVG